jgi:hypothetical protein
MDVGEDDVLNPIPGFSDRLNHTSSYTLPASPIPGTPPHSAFSSSRQQHSPTKRTKPNPVNKENCMNEAESLSPSFSRSFSSSETEGDAEDDQGTIPYYKDSEDNLDCDTIPDENFSPPSIDDNKLPTSTSIQQQQPATSLSPHHNLSVPKRTPSPRRRSQTATRRRSLSPALSQSSSSESEKSKEEEDVILVEQTPTPGSPPFSPLSQSPQRSPSSSPTASPAFCLFPKKTTAEVQERQKRLQSAMESPLVPDATTTKRRSRSRSPSPIAHPGEKSGNPKQRSSPSPTAVRSTQQTQSTDPRFKIYNTS